MKVDLISIGTLMKILSVLSEEQKNDVLEFTKGRKEESIVIENYWLLTHSQWYATQENAMRFEHSMSQALNAYINNADETMSASDVYGQMGMPRQVWGTHINGQAKHFRDKNDVLRFAIILHLRYWDTVYLLHMNGYNFPKESDEIVRITLSYQRSGEYSERNSEERLKDIDNLLYDNGAETLFSER